jgi:hypothetical protein
MFTKQWLYRVCNFVFINRLHATPISSLCQGQSNNKKFRSKLSLLLDWLVLFLIKYVTRYQKPRTVVQFFEIELCIISERVTSADHFGFWFMLLA